MYVLLGNQIDDPSDVLGVFEDQEAAKKAARAPELVRYYSSTEVVETDFYDSFEDFDTDPHRRTARGFRYRLAVRGRGGHGQPLRYPARL